MFWALINIASYQCKGTVGCDNNLLDVFVTCEVFGNMNS